MSMETYMLTLIPFKNKLGWKIRHGYQGRIQDFGKVWAGGGALFEKKWRGTLGLLCGPYITC